MALLKKTNYDILINNYINKIILRNKVIHYISTDTCIGQTLSSGQYWEVWMLQYFLKYYKQGTNIIDIGANIGTTSLLMSEVISNHNYIYSFEPIYNDITYKNIIDNNLQDKIILFPYGLGNESSIYYYPKINYNSNNNFGATSIENRTNKNNNDEMELIIKKLDDFNIDNVSLIKIDVENMEILVLEGGFNLIEKNKPTIIIESYQYEKLSSSEIFKKIINLGYKVNQIPEGHMDFIMTCE